MELSPAYVDLAVARREAFTGLEAGREANAKVVQSLFQMATQDKNVAAAIFWLKTRGLGGRIEIQPSLGDPTTMSGVELEAIAPWRRAEAAAYQKHRACLVDGA